MLWSTECRRFITQHKAADTPCMAHVAREVDAECCIAQSLVLLVCVTQDSVDTCGVLMVPATLGSCTAWPLAMLFCMVMDHVRQDKKIRLLQPAWDQLEACRGKTRQEYYIIPGSLAD